MLRNVLSIVMPFDGGREEINLACDVTQRIDEWQILRHRLPPLYETGIRWHREVCAARRVPGACERFVTARECILEFREGTRLGSDCDDLAPWRAAELRLAAQGRAPWLRKYGANKYAHAAAIESPGIGWHIVVLGKNDVLIEDPSVRLGMLEAMKGG